MQFTQGVSTMKATLAGATTFTGDDRINYSALYLAQPVQDEVQERAKGLVIMKLPCSEEVYNSLPSFNDLTPVEVDLVMKRGGGGKMAQTAVAVRVIGGTKPVKQAG
jgi:hypothetical protein